MIVGETILQRKVAQIPQGDKERKNFKQGEKPLPKICIQNEK